MPDTPPTRVSAGAGSTAHAVDDRATVLIRLAGPLQAWSRERRTHGKEGRRPTSDHPTKTGVIGLVANALGRDRADDIQDLAALSFAVRADQPGTRQTDFHTAGGGTMPTYKPHPSGGPVQTPEHAPYGAPKGVKTSARGRVSWQTQAYPVVTYDEYLADAIFTAALTGPAALVDQIAEALDAPARLLHLGRAAYLPTGRLLAGTTGVADPVAALAEAPLAGNQPGPVTAWADAQPDRSARGIISGGPTGRRVINDQPLNYATRETVGRIEQTITINPPAPQNPSLCPPLGPSSNPGSIPVGTEISGKSAARGGVDFFAAPDETAAVDADQGWVADHAPATEFDMFAPPTGD